MTSNKPAPSIRGQLIFRNNVPGEPWFNVGVGIIEAPLGRFKPDAIHPILLPTGERHAIHIEAESLAIRNVSRGSIDQVAAGLKIPARGGIKGIMPSGGVFLRQSRFPSRPGHETFIAVAVIDNKSTNVPERIMLTLEGTGPSFALVPSHSIPTAFGTGASLEDTMQLPIWGFEGPSRGFASTMHLERIDQIHELTALEAKDHLTPGEFARLDALAGSVAASIVRSRSTDPNFLRFEALAKEEGIDLELPYDAYPTHAELAVREREIQRILTRMMEEEPQSTYGR